MNRGEGEYILQVNNKAINKANVSRMNKYGARKAIYSYIRHEK